MVKEECLHSDVSCGKLTISVDISTVNVKMS